MKFASFPFKTDVILVEQPLYSFYAASIPASLLLEVAFSDAMQANIKADGTGYTVEATQRIIQSKRLAQIAKYIDREDAGFPNSIILAANYRQDGLIEEDEGDIVDSDRSNHEPSKRWSVESSSSGRLELTIPSGAKLAAVIDGQHRLFAFAETKVPERLEMNLLCSIFIDLPKPYQAQIFATINSNQKPVDKSLTYELFGYNIDEEAPAFWSPDKLAVSLTRKLSVDSASPLRGRIQIAPKKDATIAGLVNSNDWKVSTAVVVEGVMRLFSTNPKRDAQAMLTPTRSTRMTLNSGPKDRSPMREQFVEVNDQLIFTLVLNFLKACEKSLWSVASSGSFITKTVGVQALFDVLRRVLAPMALAEKNLKVEFFAEILSRASGIDFGSDAYKNASGSGRSAIRKAIEAAISNDLGQQ
jgi:DNA phosphorothioation-associated DGQHR protein 1